MAKKKVFLSFDFANDHDIKESFISQARLHNSPYSLYRNYDKGLIVTEDGVFYCLVDYLRRTTAPKADDSQ